MKVFLSVIISALITTKAFCQYGAPTTIKTPTNVSVSATLETEFSAPEIQAYNAQWDNFLLVNHSVLNAKRVGDVSALYNCHSYAWHVSDGGNKVWVADPGLYFTGQPPSYFSTTESTGRRKKVKYSTSNHSAITTDTLGRVISKWGIGPLVLHNVDTFPTIFNETEFILPPPESVVVTYYIIQMSGASAVQKGTVAAVSTTLNISNANYNWSGDGNYVCAVGSSINGSVTGLNITNTSQGKAYVSIHSPYSNTTVKGVKYLNVTSAPSTPIISGPTLVCASGGSFSLNYIPAGNSLTWSSGSYLSTNNIHANPTTFTSSGNGPDNVTATLSTPCSSNVIPVTPYPVWSGSPVFNTIYGPYSVPNRHDASFYVVPDAKEAINSYTWNLNPLNGNHLYPSGPSLIIAFYNTGNYQLLVSAHNTCGTGPVFWRGVSVYPSNSLIISPNPASTTVNVAIVKDNAVMASDSTTFHTEAAISDDQTKYTVSIYNSFGTKFLSVQKSSSQFSLQVGNLQNGLYLVVVSDGKNEYSKQLVVKH